MTKMPSWHFTYFAVCHSPYSAHHFETIPVIFMSQVCDFGLSKITHMNTEPEQKPFGTLVYMVSRGGPLMKEQSFSRQDKARRASSSTPTF